MGYTHYFEQNRHLTDEEFNNIVLDFLKVVGRPHGIQIAGWNGMPDTKPEVTQTVISFNGLGEDSHETMVLKQVAHGFQFCKTAYKPYDRLVTALLIIVNYHADDAFDIGSDGSRKDWVSGRDLVWSATGLEMPIPQEVTES